MEHVDQNVAFISHAGRDGACHAAELHRTILAAHPRLFPLFDERLPWGDTIAEIKERLSFSDVFLVVLTDGYGQSNWCHSECSTQTGTLRRSSWPRCGAAR